MSIVALVSIAVLVVAGLVAAGYLIGLHRLAAPVTDVPPPSRSHDVRTHLVFVAGPKGVGKSVLEAVLSRSPVSESQLRSIPSSRSASLGREVLLARESVAGGDVVHAMRHWDSVGEQPSSVLNALLKGGTDLGPGERAIAILVLSLADITANHRFYTRELVDAVFANDAARACFSHFIVFLNQEDRLRSQVPADSADEVIAAETSHMTGLLKRVLGGGYTVEVVHGSALTGMGMHTVWSATLRGLGLQSLFDGEELHAPAHGPDGAPAEDTRAAG